MSVTERPATGPDDAGDVVHLTPTPEPENPRPGRRALALVGIAAALVAALVAPTLVWGGDEPTERTVVPAAGPADGEWLLLDGWEITHVDQYETETEATFSKGRRTLDVHWRATKDYEGFLTDRQDIGEADQVEVLGRTGRLFAYSDTDFTVLLPPVDDVFIELRGSVGDRAAFDAVLADLRPATDEQWYAALPDSVVTPEQEKAVAAQMLQGVPKPPGFNRKDLVTGQTQDYYQYGAHVTGLVVCGWIESWIAAGEDGDTAAETAAEEALAGSRGWAVLQRMDAEGAWPEVVWEYSDSVTKGAPVSGGKDGLTVEGTYEDAFGCA